MTDMLPPLPKCKRAKRGGHDMSYFVNESDGGSITQACDACGIVRRFAVEGHLAEIPLDDLTVDEIGHLFGGRVR